MGPAKNLCPKTFRTAIRESAVLYISYLHCYSFADTDLEYCTVGTLHVGSREPLSLTPIGSQLGLGRINTPRRRAGRDVGRGGM